VNELIDNAIAARPELAEIPRADLERMLSEFMERIIQDSRLRKIED